MALLVKDRIKETTSTTGTGTLTLAGAVAGYQAFSVLGNGATTYYALTDANGTAWEVGLGTYTTSGTTLARTTVLDSSNSGSKITLTSGTHDVFVTYPADKAGFNDEGLAKTFTASGTITAGKACILEADGDAAQIASSTSGVDVTEGWGTLAKITDNEGSKGFVSDDIGSGKVFVSYQDDNNSDYPTLVVATISGSGKSVTYGTPVVATSEACEETAVVWDSNASRFGVFWKRTSDGYIRGSTGTVSGTVPTIGTGTNLDATQINYKLTGIFDPDQNDVIILYYGLDGGDYNAHASVIDISGSTPSVSYTVESPTLNGDVGGDGILDLSYDTSADKFLIMSEESGGGGGGGNAIVMTNSGTALTLGSITEIRASSFDFPSVCFDDSVNKFLIGFSRSDDSDREYAIVGTISGTSVSFGTEVKLSDTGHNTHSAIGFDTTADKSIMFVGGHSGTSTYYTISITGTAPSVVATGTVTGHGAGTYSGQQPRMSRTSITSESENPFLLVFKDTGSDSDIACQVFEFAQSAVTTTNLDNNYLGVASTTASDTNPVDINIVGSINNNQTGLTVGDDYFSDDAGNIKKFITSATSTNASPTGNFTTMDDSDTTSVDVSSTYESNSGTYVLAYKDASNSSYGTAVAGTWSSGTVTWGTPVVFESSAIDDQPHICSGGNRVHVTYRASDATGGIRSASISGTAMTFAAETIFAPNNATYGNPMGYHCVYDTSTNYVIIAYSGGTGTPHDFFAQPLYHDTSDGTYTLGTSVVLMNNNVTVSHKTDLVFDPDTNRSIVIYSDGTNSNQITAQVIQSTGSSGSPTVTAGADSIIDAGDGGAELCACYDTENNKVFVAYKNTSDSNAIKGIIGTVTGGGTNTIAFTGNADIWDPSGNPTNFDIEFDGDNNKAFFFYRDEDSGDDLTYKILTLGASSFSVAAGAVLSANDNRLNSGAASFGTGKGVLVGLWDAGNSSKISYATVYYGTTTTYTKTNSQYIGKALSATALELKDQDPNTLYGQSEGAIAKGKPVIVEADGDFSEAQSNSQTTNYTYSKGTETELVAGDMLNTVKSCYDANVDRFVVAYMDGDVSNYGRAVVVSTSGTTPTVTATATFDAVSWAGENPMPVYDSVNKKVVIIYQAGNDSNKGESIVATVGASSISFGTSVQYNNSSQGGSGDRHAYFDEANEKIVLYGRDQSNSNYPTVWIGTVSGTSITWGSGVVIESSGITGASAAQYSSGSGKGLFVWEDASNYGQVIVGTVSGTSMTFGSKLQFTTENINSSFAGKVNPLCYDSVADKFLFLYQIASGDDGEGIVFTISGTSVTKGAETNLHDNWTNHNTIGKSDFGKIPIIYRNSSNHAYYAEVTITGTTPALSGEAVLNSGTTYFNGLSLDTTQGDIKLLATYEDSSNDLASTVIIPNGTRTVSTPNLTTENYIGIAKDAASDNDTAIIQTVGSTDNNQSSLTPGQVYYVQTDGTLSTTAGDPSVVAGRAISATEILITRS